MAEKIVIDLEAKTDKAIKEIEKVSESITELNQEVVKGNKNTSKSLDSVEESASSVSKGIKGFGLALKAAGIGLVISALTTMKEIFSQNQRVVDIFSTGLETFSIVINQVVTAFFNVYDAITSNNKNFDALGKVVKGVLNIAITPLKLSFYAIKLGIQQAQLAWEQSFFGGKDKEVIKQLNLDILETKKAFFETGASAIKSGVDVVNNFKEATGEIINIGVVAGNELSKISVRNAYDRAKANVELKKSAEIAAAQQSRLVEQYDRQAEKLRQVRDDERNSLEVRKKANDDLLATLDAQEKAMISQADLQVAAAQNEFNKNKNIENQIALIDALSNREGVLAQIEGFRSEQQANDLALSKEAIELTNSKLESESKLSIERKRFNAEQIEDELLRLQKLKEVDLLEAEQETLRLQAIVDNANAGTQAKIDAQIALDTFLEESRQKEVLREKEISTAKIEIAKREEEAKTASLLGYAGALSRISGLINQETAEGKALAVASSLINTYASIVGQLRAFAKVPIPGYAIAQAIATGAVGFANVKKILSVKIPKASNVTSNTPNTSFNNTNILSQPPAFNVVGASETNQLADAIGGQAQQPVRAYVVSNDVTTAQSMDRNIVSGASI